MAEHKNAYAPILVPSKRVAPADATPGIVLDLDIFDILVRCLDPHDITTVTTARPKKPRSGF